LSSIFFSQDKEVLILGAKVQALMQSSNDHEYNEAMSDVWQVYDRPEETGKAIWLASLVYYAIAGKPYFLDRQQREPLPLSLYFNESNRISSIVDAMLQEKGSVNDGAGAFLESFAEIAQNTRALDLVTEQTAELKKRVASDDKKIKLDRFFSLKGAFVILASIGLLAAAVVLGLFIKKQTAPPATCKMDRSEVISMYFNAINDLDTQALSQTLARGARSPAENEVSSFYVTKTVRRAYESDDFYDDPQKWVDEGYPPIVQGHVIYGAADISIESLGDDKARVTNRFFSPIDYFDPKVRFSDEDPTKTEIYEYLQVQDFTFSLKKDCLQIASIEEVSFDFVKTYTVDYIQRINPKDVAL